MATDTRLHYRVGAPQLRTLPLETVPFQHLIPGWWSILLSGIGKILREERVHILQYDIVRRKREGETTALLPRTLLVLSDVTIDGQYAKWIKAASRLRAFLYDLGHDILVEIIDVNATKFNSDVITESDTTVIDFWSRFQGKLLDALAGMEWLAIDVLWKGFGETGTVRYPTVLISAPDADDGVWWDKVIPQLRAEALDGQ